MYTDGPPAYSSSSDSLLAKSKGLKTTFGQKRNKPNKRHRKKKMITEKLVGIREMETSKTVLLIRYT